MAQAPASNVKLKKRGEYIVKPGERPKSVYFVVSGKVNLLQAKGDKKIELMQAADSHTIGEELISSAQWTSGAAVVLKDAQVMEIPVDALKQMITSVPAMPKALLNGLLERVKSTSNQLKALHTQQERTPCPPDSTARLF